MKDDLISRSWLLDVVEHFVPWDTEKDRNRAIHHVRELAPSVQPERIRGRWEIYVISMLDGEGCRCSECGFEGVPYWDFCPNCGADMREKGENG